MLGAIRKLRADLAAMRQTIIWELLRAQWRWVLLILLPLSALSFTCTLAYANGVRDAIDKAIVDKSAPLSGFIKAMVVAAFLLWPIGIALRQTTARIGYTIEYQVRVRLYDRLQALNPRTLDKLATGQLMTRAVTDLAMLELFVVIIPTLAVTFVIIGALAVVILVQSPLMAALALSSVPINGWLVMRIRYRLLGLSWMRLHRRAEVTTAIDEAVRGIRVVKAFGREDYERGRVAAAARAAYAVALNRVRLLAKFDVLLRLLPGVFTLLEILLAGQLIGRSAFTIGKLLILLYFAQALTAFAQSFSDIADAWQAARAGATRITELLDQIPPDRRADPDPLPPVSTGLSLEAVSFRSLDADAADDAEEGAVDHGRRLLLEELDLGIAPGELVVVHGAPGSGKSLIAALAAGRVPPSAGRVLLDGSDLLDLDPLEVTRAVRLLTEDPFLFGRTVRENLAMGAASSGRPASDQEVLDALVAANAAEFVNDLSDGIDTQLGDRGMTLSGGQRQRLALARALVAPPRVLVLDDALAAVNPALEIDIVRRLRVLAPEMGILCITRREGLRTLADRIIELPDRREPGAQAADRARAAESTAAVDPMAFALAAFGGQLPPKLLSALATLPAETDQPPVTEEAARDSEHPPTVVGILRPLAKPALLAIGCLVAFTSVNLIPPALYKLVTDDFNAGTHGVADKVAFAVLLVAFGAGAANYLFKITAAKVNEGVLYVLRRRLFQRLSNLGVDYYDRELPGQVAARAVYDLDRISGFTESGVYTLLVNVTLLVAAMGVISIWSPEVAARVVPVVPVLLFFSALQVPVADRAYDRQRKALGEVVERMQEDIAGRYVIDSFGARPMAIEAFHHRADALRKARRWSSLVGSGYVESMNTAGNLAGALLISTAGGIALRGELSVGSLVALELYLITALGPIAFLSDALQRLMAARASFRTLRTPFEAPIRPVDRAGARPATSAAGALRLSSVRFAYPGTAREVLHDVDLVVPAGSSLALVGPTGAGKTSVAKLMARVYDVDSGSVTVGDDDVPRSHHRQLPTTARHRSAGRVLLPGHAARQPGLRTTRGDDRRTARRRGCGARRGVAFGPRCRAGGAGGGGGPQPDRRPTATDRPRASAGDRGRRVDPRRGDIEPRCRSRGCRAREDHGARPNHDLRHPPSAGRAASRRGGSRRRRSHPRTRHARRTDGRRRRLRPTVATRHRPRRHRRPRLSHTRSRGGRAGVVGGRRCSGRVERPVRWLVPPRTRSRCGVARLRCRPL